jgi:hypothetical protein
MEFKGTKEKWFIDNEESHIMTNGIYCNVISTEKTISLADVYGDDEEAQANALLISKAPEMLEMLNNQLEFLIYCRDNMKVLRPVFNQKIVRIKQLIKEATEI